MLLFVPGPTEHEGLSAQSLSIRNYSLLPTRSVSIWLYTSLLTTQYDQHNHRDGVYLLPYVCVLWSLCVKTWNDNADNIHVQSTRLPMHDRKVTYDLALSSQLWLPVVLTGEGSLQVTVVDGSLSSTGLERYTDRGGPNAFSVQVRFQSIEFVSSIDHRLSRFLCTHARTFISKKHG